MIKKKEEISEEEDVFEEEEEEKVEKKNHMKMRMKTLQDQTQRHHLGGFKRIILKVK